MVIFFTYILIFVLLIINGFLIYGIYAMHRQHKEKVKDLNNIILQNDLEREQFERMLTLTKNSKTNLDESMLKMGDSIVELQKIFLNALSKKKSN